MLGNETFPAWEKSIPDMGKKNSLRGNCGKMHGGRNYQRGDEVDALVFIVFGITPSRFIMDKNLQKSFINSCVNFCF